MRITPNATAYNALYYIQQGRSKLDSLQEKIATGYNYNRPSDDPVTTNMLLTANDQLLASKQYQSNITKGNTFLKMSATALDGMSSIVASAKKLVGTITSGTSDTTISGNVVSQLTTLREQLADMGNTQLNGQYIFAGSKTSTKPFDTAVGSSTYHGDSVVNSLQIDVSSSQKLNITGDQVLASASPGVNILQQMDTLIAAIQADPTNTTAIAAGATALEKGADQITSMQTEVASRQSRMTSVSKMLDTTSNTLSGIIGDTQNVDTAELAVKLTLQQTAFNASLSATAKISQMSLLDYIG